MIAFFVIRRAFWFFYHLFDWQIKLLSKFIVTFIMRWHCHNCTFTIPHQDIIRHPNWNLLTSSRIYYIRACEHPCFFLVFLALNLGFLQGIGLILFYLSLRFLCNEFFNGWVLWCKNEKCRTKNCIWTSGKDFDICISN